MPSRKKKRKELIQSVLFLFLRAATIGEPQRPVILSPHDSKKKDSYLLRWSIKSPYNILQQQVNYWEKRPVSVPKSTVSFYKLCINANPISQVSNYQGGSYNNERRAEEEGGNQLLHLQSHEQNRLTTARIIEDGLYPEKNTFVYEVRIPELRPDRSYVVQVKATNKFHEGDWSEQFEFETSGKGDDDHRQFNWGSYFSAWLLKSIFTVPPAPMCISLRSNFCQAVLLDWLFVLFRRVAVYIGRQMAGDDSIVSNFIC